MTANKKQANKGSFVPGDSRINHNGRTKGAKNKTASAWDSMAAVFEMLGDNKRFVAWVKESKLNERIFYTAYMSKARTEVGIDVTGNLNMRFDYDVENGNGSD